MNRCHCLLLIVFFFSFTDLLQCSLLVVKVAVPAGALEVYRSPVRLLYDFSPLDANIILYLVTCLSVLFSLIFYWCYGFGS